MVPPYSHGISRVPQYSGYSLPALHFAYVILTLSDWPSHAILLCSAIHSTVRTPSVLLLSVWPLPRSLATTCGISVDVSSSPYLDVSVQAVPFLRLFDSTQDDWILSSRVAPFGNPRINGYLLLPEAFRSLSRPSSAPDAKAFPLRSFQLDLSPFSQRLVREFLVLFENYAGFTKIEIVCHPASFRMLFHNQFVSSVSPQRNLSVALLAFVTLFSFQGADRRPQASACLRHSFQPLLQSDLKIRSFDQVFKSKGKSPGGPEWARTTDLTIISRTL